MPQNKKICLAVDAMGGDWGPSIMIPAALKAAKQNNLILKFVGLEDSIEAELKRQNIAKVDIDVVHANDVARMEDKPSHILRRNKNTSIQVCCNLVKNDQADGVISAGHTGVTLACSIFTIGRIKGIERPGLAAFLPREHKPLILIDIGANVDSKPRHLVQFAIMGEALARNVLKINEPMIGLLNIGEEQGKGNLQVSEAYNLLDRTSLNFIGNIEGRDLFTRQADIVVCDGFVGNVALKLSEGLGSSFVDLLRRELRNGFWSRMGALMAKTGLKKFRRRLDYHEYGGAPLLGLNNPVFVCHGAAKVKAIQKAATMLATFVTSKANDDIKHGLEINPEITKLQRLKKMLHPSSGAHDNHDEQEEISKE